MKDSSPNDNDNVFQDPRRCHDWQHKLGRLRALGYEGAVGLEYKPTMPATQSLKAARAATGL